MDRVQGWIEAVQLTPDGEWCAPRDWRADSGQKAGSCSNIWYGMIPLGWLGEWTREAMGGGEIINYDQGRARLRVIAQCATEGYRGVWREATARWWQLQRSAEQERQRAARTQRVEGTVLRRKELSINRKRKLIKGVKCAVRRQEYKSALTNVLRVVRNIEMLEVEKRTKAEWTIMRTWGTWDLMEMSMRWKKNRIHERRVSGDGVV
jgi:hypothetical protein